MEEQENDLFADSTDSTELLSGLNDYAAELIRSDGEKAKAMLPHIIFSHGFQAWYQLLLVQFPAFSWWEREEIIEEGVIPEDAHRNLERLLFDRFFAHLTSMSTFHWLGKEEKRELREEAWLGYLAD